jgi:hypothetical protein
MTLKKFDDFDLTGALLVADMDASFMAKFPATVSPMARQFS